QLPENPQGRGELASRRHGRSYPKSQAWSRPAPMCRRQSRNTRRSWGQARQEIPRKSRIPRPQPCGSAQEKPLSRWTSRRS
ncbi:Unknown protein, partial [Striga hermonthica]